MFSFFLVAAGDEITRLVYNVLKTFTLFTYRRLLWITEGFGTPCGLCGFNLVCFLQVSSRLLTLEKITKIRLQSYDNTCTVLYKLTNIHICKYIILDLIYNYYIIYYIEFDFEKILTFIVYALLKHFCSTCANQRVPVTAPLLFFLGKAYVLNSYFMLSHDVKM